MLIGISCIHILLNKKVHLYVNEKWRGHVHNLKLTANQKYSPLQMTTLKFLQNGWQDGEQEKGNLQTLRNLHLSLQSSQFDENPSTYNLKNMWLTSVLNFEPNDHRPGYFTEADTFLHVDPFSRQTSWHLMFSSRPFKNGFDIVCLALYLTHTSIMYM